MDGNKRTAFLGMLSLLYEYKIELLFAEDEAYDFVVSMSTGDAKFEHIVDWLTSKQLA